MGLATLAGKLFEVHVLSREDLFKISHLIICNIRYSGFASFLLCLWENCRYRLYEDMPLFNQLVAMVDCIMKAFPVLYTLKEVTDAFKVSLQQFIHTLREYLLNYIGVTESVYTSQ